MHDERDDTTATFRDSADVAAIVSAHVALPALTIIWSAEEPHRVGESAVFEGARPWIIGRDATTELFAPRRPNTSIKGAPLGGDVVSRKQLEIDYVEDGDGPHALTLRNVGKAPVTVNGRALAQGQSHDLFTGDVIVVGERYALLAGERPAAMRASLPYPSAHAFGDADAIGIVGESYAAWTLRERLAFAADARTHVLVLGETGSGKELAARAVHALSDRAKKTYLPRNAASFSPGVIEAEIFGCVKNLTSGNMPEREGMIGAADGGTLMLDEIGTLSKEMQAKLLTFLDAGSYFRVGDTRERRANVRVVGATNVAVSDLKDDLGPRFKVKVEVPPLSKRREDIPLLARHLVLGIARESEHARRFVVEAGGRKDVRMSSALVTALVRRHYAGNTRDLEGVLRDAMRESAGDRIELTPSVAATAQVKDAEALGDASTLSDAAMLSALQKSGGNASKAARMLNVGREDFRYQVKARKLKSEK